MIVLAYLLIFPAFADAADPTARSAAPVPAPGGNRMPSPSPWSRRGWALLAAVCLLWPGFGTAIPTPRSRPASRAIGGRFEMMVLTPIAADGAALCLILLAFGRKAGDGSTG